MSGSQFELIEIGGDFNQIQAVHIAEVINNTATLLGRVYVDSLTNGLVPTVINGTTSELLT
jgi:hypothetical protein